MSALTVQQVEVWGMANVGFTDEPASSFWRKPDKRLRLIATGDPKGERSE
jgi:hypothetical protein